MPFKVNYNIMEKGKGAPCFSSFDRQLAYVELHDRQRKGNITDYWMTYDITPIDMTNQEGYMWLVYQVRQAQKKYWRDGKLKEDLKASLNLESALDKWNADTRTKLNAIHKKNKNFAPKDAGAYQFFVTVEDWRVQWKNYFAAKKRGNHEESARLFVVCQELEKRIDEYCSKQLGL